MTRPGHNLHPRVAARVVGTPLAIDPRKLEAILGAIGPRIGLSADQFSDLLESHSPVEQGRSQVAVLPVLGTLVHRGFGGMESLSGIASYESLNQQLDALLADDSVGGIVLDVDSYGGEVEGMLDLADKIAQASKPVWAVANGAAYSAGYALASAASRLYVTRTGGVGSIGVVGVHVDQSGMDRDRGLAYEFVHAGEKKVDGHGHGPLSDRARADMQSDVDRLYGLFLDLVASHGRIDRAKAKATEAGTYLGEQAVEAGLADRVGNLTQAVADMRAELGRNTSQNAARREFVRATKEKTHAA